MPLLTTLNQLTLADDTTTCRWTASEVQGAIDKTPTNKAPGPDCIEGHMLHDLGELDTFISVLQAVFNGHLQYGCFPQRVEDWQRPSSA